MPLCPSVLRLFDLALSRGERAGPVRGLKREGEEVIAAPRGPARLISPEPAAPQRGGCGGGEVEGGGDGASSGAGHVSHAAVDVKRHRALSLRVLPPRVKHIINLHLDDVRRRREGEGEGEGDRWRFFDGKRNKK